MCKRKGKKEEKLSALQTSNRENEIPRLRFPRVSCSPVLHPSFFSAPHYAFPIAHALMRLREIRGVSRLVVLGVRGLSCEVDGVGHCCGVRS